MKGMPSNRLGAVTTKSLSASRRSLTPLRALPKDRICEDVYPGGFRSTLAGRIYPVPKGLPFPNPLPTGSIESTVNHTLREFSAPVSLCAMLFFAPPVHYFSAFRSIKRSLKTHAGDLA